MKFFSLFSIVVNVIASGQNYEINRSTIGSAKIESASNSFQIKGTLGQAHNVLDTYLTVKFYH